MNQSVQHKSYDSVTHWVKTARTRETFFNCLSHKMKTLQLKEKRHFFKKIKQFQNTKNPEEIYLHEPINLKVGLACLFLLL